MKNSSYHKRFDFFHEFFYFAINKESHTVKMASLEFTRKENLDQEKRGKVRIKYLKFCYVFILIINLQVERFFEKTTKEK